MAETGIAARLDELVKIANEHTGASEEQRIEAIRRALPSDGLDQLAAAAKARFDSINQAGKESDEVDAALSALADVYTAVLPSLQADQPKNDDKPTDAKPAQAPPAPPQQAKGEAPPKKPEAIEGEVMPRQPAPGDERNAGGGGPVIPEGSDRELVGAGKYSVMSDPRDLSRVPLSAYPTDPVTGKELPARFQAYAGGDHREISSGTPFASLMDIANVTLEKFQGLRDGGGGFGKSGIVTWQDTKKPDLYPGMSAFEAARVIDQAGDWTGKLPTFSQAAGNLGALSAAPMTFTQPNGADAWCRPSDLLLQFCPPASTDGMWDAPSLTISGAGVRWPRDWDFTSIYTQLGMNNPEAGSGAFCYDNNYDGSEKPCARVPCPPFDECRLKFCGLCIEASTLIDLAWPELVASYVAKALAAFAHMMNCRFLTEAWETAGTPIDVTASRTPGTTIENVLDAVIRYAAWIRYKHRFAFNRPFEAVMPRWLLDMMLSDAMMRCAVENFIGTSVANINSWFASKGIRVQWVYDFDDALCPLTPPSTPPFGDPTTPVEWPSKVKVLLYPAGTFQLARRPMVRVSGVRNDPQLLRQNVFLALFMETAYCLIARCPEVVALNIDICNSGGGCTPQACK